jgi:NADPH-dependent curcumin reductase CurA
MKPLIVGRVAGGASASARSRRLPEDAFNYKAVKDYAAKPQEVCPQGIDVYFDNVGGPLSDLTKRVAIPNQPKQVSGGIHAACESSSNAMKRV